MKKIIQMLFVAVIAISTLNADTALEDIVSKGKLVLGTSGNMTPMTRSINDGKDAVGFDIDLAKAMADSMGVELEVKVIEFEKLIPALKSGKIDMIISNMTITPKRNTQVAFVGPYLTSGKCLITKKPDLASAKKEQLNKASNKMVVLKGTTDEDFVRKGMPNVKAITVTTQEDAIELVRNSEVSAMLSEYPICKAIIANNPDDHFISVFSNLTYEPIGVAIAPENTHMINWTENFLIRANKQGLLKLLGKKWFK
jgi:polar amino acid transport system substrate-binding protein